MGGDQATQYFPAKTPAGEHRKLALVEECLGVDGRAMFDPEKYPVWTGRCYIFVTQYLLNSENPVGSHGKQVFVQE